MNHKTHVCPWWLIHTFDNPLRKLFQNGETMLRPWIESGQTAIDLGCGIGYFTIPIARLIGPQGKVYAVDLQQEMLQGLQRRAEKAGVAERIQTIQATPEDINLHTQADFILAFWMLHEVPDQLAFLKQIHGLLTAGSKLLLTEPKFHVSRKAFAKSVRWAEQAGLHHIQEVKISLSRAGLFSS